MTTKTIFQLNIGEYDPDVIDQTYPRVDAYAEKIGADVVRITERKYPDLPISYEKFQIHELASSDWNIYIDSDFLIHPEFFDLTPYLDKSEVTVMYNNVAPGRYATDKYFQRDGRHISVPTSFCLVSDWCLDFWKPTELTREQVAANIFEMPREHFTGDTSWRMDDYIVSRNIARYGLKVNTVSDIYKKIFNHSRLEYYFHPQGSHKKGGDIRLKIQEWDEQHKHHEHH